MIFYILTLFPEMVKAPLHYSILGKAIEKGIFRLETINIREFGIGKHKVVDDYPYGGGEGLVMKPEPIISAIKSLISRKPRLWVVLLTPDGIPFTQKTAHRFSKMKAIALVCGRYEGVDERIRAYVNEEVSIGDYVLTGGEMAALVIVDAVVRLIPGTLHSPLSTEEESFSRGLLEYPQFTRPFEFNGRKVPEILLSGDHKSIRCWRFREAFLRTWIRRPELLRGRELTMEEKELLKDLEDVY